MTKDIEVKILSALKDCSKTKAEIEQETKIKDKEVGYTLQNLKKRGQAELIAGKRWQITEEGRKGLGKEKEAREKGKHELTKTEKEQIAIKRYNAGVHPRKVAEEIGDIDLATETYEKWEMLNKSEYSKCLRWVKEKHYANPEEYNYTHGPVFYGLEALSSTVDKLREENAELKNSNSRIPVLEEAIQRGQIDALKYWGKYTQLRNATKVLDKLSKSFPNENEVVNYIVTSNLLEKRVNHDLEKIKQLEEQKIRLATETTEKEKELKDLSRKITEEDNCLNRLLEKERKTLEDMQEISQFKEIAEYGCRLRVMR